MTVGTDHDRPEHGARRVFKRFKFTELSLVKEPCVPGADAVVIKTKNKDSTTGRESVSGGGLSLGVDSGAKAVEAAVAKSLQPFAALNTQLQASAIQVDQYIAKAREMAASLTRQAISETEPVAKRAAGTAATIITETAMNFEQMQAALEASEANTTVITKARDDALALVAVEKSRADTAVAALKIAETTIAAEVAKSKPVSPEDAEEAVIKSMPESMQAIVRKAKADLKANEEAIAKAKGEAQTAAIAADEEAVTKSLKGVGLPDADKVAKALVAIKHGKGDAAAAEMIGKTLETVAKSALGGTLFRSAGSENAIEFDGDPETALQVAAAEIKKAKPGLTKEQAYDEALTANPAVYSAMVAKRRAANPVAH